ncbi:hypothetical protein CHGG_08775 [Chaetomium globosum CBS 148.51]|uniref:UVI-1 protein n=1 Tax=Chaetomium globosum (strain ATCC 6205 / CBS 148.51 / DSM 1962 / NBRC 6347 / NRRL 1970) TaxID=306901 RepID=Q2GTC9_CHAGB|nr:uncharacterized protein CHGG_08775 [Chaetomium globosum CBS 148.51]EAQ84761.1 hypothetical protein CHGG_08775 [Chaetomium globosum CBS 148.51]
MRFSILTVLAALGSVTLAQMKATVVVENIQVLTVKSQKLIQPAKELTLANAPLLILGQGPWPSYSASAILLPRPLSMSVPCLPAPRANYTGVEATAIADAFRLFVKTHQTLLDALIGVGGFITKIPFAGPPVAAVLRSVEKVVDTLALGIIGTLEASVAAALSTDYAGLKATIGTAITTFS